MKHKLTGLAAALWTWLCGLFASYNSHLPTITAWLIHLAQIAGLVIAYYSIRILHRNWRSKVNSIDPTK